MLFNIYDLGDSNILVVDLFCSLKYPSLDTWEFLIATSEFFFFNQNLVDKSLLKNTGKIWNLGSINDHMYSKIFFLEKQWFHQVQHWKYTQSPKNMQV